MEFHNFLKEIREKSQLTQQEIINDLSSKYDILASLNLVTYGRWERGNTTPSIKKMLFIADYANYCLIDFLKNINIKLSKSEIVQMDKTISLINKIGYLSIIQSYYQEGKPEYKIIKIDKSSDPNDTQDINEQISLYNALFLGLTNKASLYIKTKNILRNNGNLIQFAYVDSYNNLHAHIEMSTHPMYSKDLLLSSLKHGASTFSGIGSENKDQELFLFISSFIYHNKNWNQKMINEILKLVLEKKNISSIIFSIAIPDMARFIANNFNGKIIHAKKNENYTHSSIVNRLVEVKVKDLLSNSGIINIIRKNIV